MPRKEKEPGDSLRYRFAVPAVLNFSVLAKSEHEARARARGLVRCAEGWAVPMGPDPDDAADPDGFVGFAEDRTAVLRRLSLENVEE